MRWRIGRRARPSAERGQHWARLALAPLLGVMAALAWAAVGGAGSATPVAHADSTSGTLNIVFPAPSSGVATGPVGANVTIKASGLNSSDQYTLGVAPKDVTCAAGFSPIIGNPFGVGSGGSYSDTFVWPNTAPVNAVGTNYVICLHDVTQTVPDVVSQQAYVVASANPPAIKLAHASTPAATPGQPTPPPLNDSTYYPSDQIRVTGSNFVPGQQLGAYLGSGASGPPETRPDLGVGLKLTDGSLGSANDGSFVATIQLPDTKQLQPGSYQICVVSGDGSDSAPPSLEACKKITVQTQPTPPPTATSTTVPPTATTGGGTSSGGGGNTNPNLGAIIGLGGLSVVLFFAGVILLASAAAMPRPDRPR